MEQKLYRLQKFAVSGKFDLDGMLDQSIINAMAELYHAQERLSVDLLLVYRKVFVPIVKELRLFFAPQSAAETYTRFVWTCISVDLGCS